MNVRGQELLNNPACLERELVGLRLDELLRELDHTPVAVAPANDPTGAIRRFLGGYLSPVLHQGLRALPVPLLKSLLQNPELLLQLQELVLSEGGQHWQELLQVGAAGSAAPEPTHRQALRWSRQLAQEKPRRLWPALAGVSVLAVLATVVVLVLAEFRLARLEQTRVEEVARLQQRLQQVEENLRRHMLNPFDDPQLKAEDLCRSFALTLGLPPAEPSAPMAAFAVGQVSETADDVPVVVPHDRAQKRLLEQLQHDAAVRRELLQRSQYYLNHPDLYVQQGARIGLSYSLQMGRTQPRE